ncbi:DUF302 domain-containing protein [Beggiatoa leptomitoformis]|uniref:DUF302 domain-containing protein n=1 Tax=Beggiatoa leptomitoformis TaxID=288004 RepID=A0A2N9YG50_9GAMM|nr:DUF302 domain-containing protein [Beggiatoa leptomitoformis]ALG68319.1 DUF302 domain-containing protein [Beggiatoa leptomitoformis]AUI69365.1 DUF302 domain-containing protein [Beggiatoa leptomitoformis]
MTQEKIIYPQQPVINKNFSIIRPFRFVFNLFRNFLTFVGLVVVSMSLFFYIQGQYITGHFDERFITFFSQFVEQLFVSDMVSAILVKTPVEQGVKIQEAIRAIQSAAEQNHIKLVARYALHKELSELLGKESRFLEVFELGDLKNTLNLVDYNPDYAVLIPYRIILYEDQNNQLWLATVNLDLFIHSAHNLDETTRLQISSTQESLLKIIGAGASGTLR